MMRAYYIVDDNGELTKSAAIDLPEGLNKEGVITYVHGDMFESDWCPGTDHAIYLNKGSGYEAVYSEGDVVENAYKQTMAGV